MYSHLSNILKGFYSPKRYDIRIKILLFIYEYRDHTKIKIDARQILHAFRDLSYVMIISHIAILHTSTIIYPPQEANHMLILQPFIIPFLEELEGVAKYTPMSFSTLLIYVGYIGRSTQRLQVVHAIYTYDHPLTFKQLRVETRIDTSNLRQVVDTLVTYSFIDKWVDNGKAYLEITPYGSDIMSLILTYLAPQ